MKGTWCVFLAAAVAGRAQAETVETRDDAREVASPRRTERLLHLGAALRGDMVAKQAAAELFASYSLWPRVDLGGAVVLGHGVGVRAVATCRVLEAYEGLVPYVQARAVLNTSSAGAGVGAGAAAGAWFELGPGRATAGLLGELASSPAHARLGSLSVFAGYELDWPGLVRKPPGAAAARPAPAPLPARASAPAAGAAFGLDLSDVKADPPPPAEPARPPETGRLAALVLDSDGDPLRAQLGLSARPNGAGKLFTVAPRLDAPVPAGDYVAVASAAGYLTQARAFRVDANSRASLEFRLRPVPESAHVALALKHIRLEEPVLFEAGKPALAAESFPLLDEVVDLLLANPTVRVRIEGRTDEARRADANLALGEQRAREVKRYLEAHGVSAGRLNAVGHALEKGDESATAGLALELVGGP